jgi:quercetin dioxygenase-like cupin family protein
VIGERRLEGNLYEGGDMDHSSEQAAKAINLGPGEGEALWIVGDTMRLKATAAETGGRFTFLENLTAPGGGPPPHRHTREDEAFYVLDGEFEILLGDETISAKPGAFVFVPRGTLHRFHNVSATPSRILVMFTPAGMEGFFAEAGAPAGEGEPPPLGPEEIERTERAAPRYGMEVHLPAD